MEMTPMTFVYLWLVIGFLFLIAEIFTFEFSLACIGISFMAMSVPAYFGFNFFVQALVFALAATVLFFNVRPFVLKRLKRKGEKPKSNSDALIGAKALVYEKIEVEKKGSIKINGDIWPAVAAENIAAGTDVIIENMDGITVTVKKA